MSKIQSPTSDLEPIRLPRFDWDHTKDFYYVAKLGSFTRAAQFLKTSQPSLSRKMMDLETDLRCKLLHRTPRGVSLTRKGEELFKIVEQTFVSLKGFGFNAAPMTDGGQKRRIRISTTHAIATYILDDLIFDYSKEHSNVVFELVTEDHLIDIIINDVDIAIRPFDPDAKGIQQELLFTLQKKLYASEEYINTFGEPKTVEDLKNHRIIAPARPEDFPYSELEWILKLGLPTGDKHQPVFTSTSIETLVKAAQKGVGIIGSYGNMSIIKKSNLINIIPDVHEIETKEYLIYPNHFRNDVEITKLRNYLVQKLALSSV